MNSVLFRLAIGAALGMATPALASDSSPEMSVAQFLGTVDGLKAKGFMALFSPDIGKLKRAGKFAVENFYAQATPPGGARKACPPPPHDLELKDSEFLGFLQAVPPPQRATTSLTQAVTVGMTRRFPCH